MILERDISAYIDKIFNGTGTITSKNLAAAARSSLRKTSHIFSREEVAVLLPFITKQVKMVPNGDGYVRTFFGRTLGGVSKDLDQMASMGMFGDNAAKKVESRRATFAEGKEQFGETYAWLNQLAENKELKQDADEYYDIVKKMGEVQEVVEKGERSFRFSVSADKPFNIQISRNEYAKFLISSLLNDFITKKDANFIVENKTTHEKIDLKMPTIYLATILTLRSVVKDDKSFNDILSNLVTPLRESITPEMFGVDNATVREEAIALCKARLEQLNLNGGTYNTDIGALFHDLVLEQQLHRRIEKVNDLAIRMTNEGSNYPFMIIKESGISYAKIEESAKFENAKEAFTNLNKASTALNSFSYLDRAIFENKEDKIIDSPEEIAEALMANLLILENSGMSENGKKTFQQMFVVPLVQCLDNLDAKAIKKAQDAALEDVKGLEILPADAYENYGKTEFSASKEIAKWLTTGKGSIKNKLSKNRVASKKRPINQAQETALSLITGKMDSWFSGRLVIDGQTDEELLRLSNLKYAGIDSKALEEIMIILDETEAKAISALHAQDGKMLTKEERKQALADAGLTSKNASKIARDIIKASKNTLTR